MAGVGNAVHVHLGGVFEELVHEHGPLGRRLDGEAHVVLQFRVRVNDLHRPSAEHEAGAHEYGVTQLLGGRQGLDFVGRDAIGRLRDFQPVEHCREQLAILGNLDALRAGAEDVHAVFLEAQGQVERRLPAELRDGAPASFTLVNVQHVFERERLEEQFVARVVVGRNGFRI